MLFPPNEQKMNKTSPGFSLKNFCRTCVTTIIDQNNGEQATRITKYIYETPTEDSKATLMDLLLIVEPQIKVDLEDDLPKIMCLNCIEQLQMAYAFIETYKEANEKLLKLLKEVELFEDSEADQRHYDDESYTEKQHFVLVDGEVVGDEQYIEKYDVEIEKIPASNHKVTNEDTRETRELKTGWPEFEEEPILDMSNGDEDDREYFSDPCNEVSDDNWNTDEALKRYKF